MPRKIVIARREVQPDSTITILYHKQIVDDGELISSENHRHGEIAPGVDVEAYIASADETFTAMGYGTIDPAEWDKLRGMVLAEHTPEVIAEYAARIEALRAARELELNGGAGE